MWVIDVSVRTMKGNSMVQRGGMRYAEGCCRNSARWGVGGGATRPEASRHRGMMLLVCNRLSDDGPLPVRLAQGKSG